MRVKDLDLPDREERSNIRRLRYRTRKAKPWAFIHLEEKVVPPSPALPYEGFPPSLRQPNLGDGPVPRAMPSGLFTILGASPLKFTPTGEQMFWSLVIEEAVRQAEEKDE